MRISIRRAAQLVVLASLFLLNACSEETPVAPPENGGGNGGGGGSQGPLNVFEIALRPQAVWRASSLAGDTPNPQLAQYYLSAFFEGGGTDARFEWQVDPQFGTLLPKTAQLETDAATVQIDNPGNTPLGFYEISVTGFSGADSSQLARTFAVVELNWQKHRRTRITNPNDPPEDLVLYPMFAPKPGPGGGDEIFFTSFPNTAAVNIWSIQADQPLASASQEPKTTNFQWPTGPLGIECFQVTPDSGACVTLRLNPLQVATAADGATDLSPPDLGRDEILFSSEMDPHVGRRPGTVSPTTPLSLWVVKRPDLLNDFVARPLTFDSTFAGLGGRPQYYSFDFLQARWDPSPTAPSEVARIGFITDLDGVSANVWLADLLDVDADARSDTLVNYRSLTDVGSVTSFDWHPEGHTVYFTTAGELAKVDVASGAVTPLPLTQHDELLADIDFVTVFDDGSGTLLAFQGSAENRTHLFVYEETSDTLVRVSPFPFGVTRNLFPRWHPQRKELAFVSDYSVAAWNQRDVPPVGNPDFAGWRRTQFPSVWTLRLADR
ncbi:MAG: hypothetical protein JSW67_14795 [Candidatus Latescibacterota bacterium]|nr:MAG: hypothetical protein JSW67_14795 [Candidatus Latescibacterota bacterium]